MAYNAAFTISSLIIPGSFIFTDASTGSDPNITSRRIGLYQADGTLLTGDWIDFPLSSSSITLDVLNVDYSLNIVYEVTSSAPLPPPSAYTASGLFTFTGNSYIFIDSLIGAIAFTSTIVQDTNYLSNLGVVQTLLDCAIRAGDTGQQRAAQECLSRVQYYINNQQILF